ncbi:MAG: alkaline phosphatase D family protein [Pirellulaceae bacterium]|nr:alkaline phosphatase D family protein [Pirellulaceae bacterium]
MLLRLLIALGAVALWPQLLPAQSTTTTTTTTAPWTKYLESRTQQVAQQSRQAMQQVTAATWPETQKVWRAELQEMLGLSPWPERTDLNVRVTSQLVKDGYRVSNVAFESRPGLFVTANLYEPTATAPPAGWPAVLYVCGHAVLKDEGRLIGNKAGYQHHGIWFARHNVVCLIIDTIQLGELHGEHHGTYKMGRWDWITRGYTPAGVEAWSSMRAIDYLETLPTVDESRIGITGRSGGGAYSWFTAALDERIDAAVPVAGITDLENHIVDGCVEGHCDCMYFVNYFGWDYNRLAALIAPRALLLANSDHDGIFPIDGVIRIHTDVADFYQRLGATNKFGLLLTPGPHQDTQELQTGAFRWLLLHLNGQPITIDRHAAKELETNQLQVFTQETPADQRVTSVSNWFVAGDNTVTVPAAAAKQWPSQWANELDRLAPQDLPQDLTVEYAVAHEGIHNKISWQLLEQQLPAPADKSTWRSYMLVLNQPALGAPASNVPAVVHVGALSETAVTPSSIPELLGEEGSLTKLVSTKPDRPHIVLLPRSQQISAASLSVRARTQLERRFYLLGDSTERLALADMRRQLQWLKRTQVLKPSISQIELVGYQRHSPLAVLAALATKSALPQDDSVAGDTPTITQVTVHDYPQQLELAPVLPGLARFASFANILQAAKGFMPVLEVNSESPSIVGEGYNQARRLLVDASIGPQQASGLRIVEPSTDSATIWCRATRWPLPNLGDLPAVEFADDPAIKIRERRQPILPAAGTAGLRYATPGVNAELRVRHRTAGKGYWQETAWAAVDVDTDYSHLFHLKDLTAGTAYEVQVQARALGGKEVSSSVSGSFKTLPEATATGNFRLAIGTCQEFDDRDGEYGMDLYRTLLHRKTDAFVLAGDVVYYDKLARSVALANYHWQRMYSMPTLINFHRQVPTYFLKDDHDTYINDSWPGMYQKWTREFTFEDGQRIFRQQTAAPDPAYRTQRIGRDLQVWFMEGRDYRGPNNAKDNPDKSIWGAQQTAWLEKSLGASDAKFKIVVSPTPIVGPDRDNKNDNYANKGFAIEGQRVRQFLAKIPNLVVVCGDRHWQYHSRDPGTGLHEFSVGPVSNRHAGGWDPKDFRKEIHQFMRVGGGYLEIDLHSQDNQAELKLTHFDPYGKLQHEHLLK